MKTVKAVERFDEVVTEQVLAQARAQGQKRRSTGLHATTLHYLPAFESRLARPGKTV